MDKLSRDEELRALFSMQIKAARDLEDDHRTHKRFESAHLYNLVALQLADVLRDADAILARHDAQGEAEPEAWQFQHNETGQMTELSRDGINTPETFMRDNPRYEYVGPLYRHPAPTSKREAVVTDGYVTALRIALIQQTGTIDGGNGNESMPLLDDNDVRAALLTAALAAKGAG